MAIETRALIEKFLHASRGLEISGAHEGAERGIDRERPIAASPQRRGQPAFHPPGGDLRHIIGEASKRACRKACQHVVLAVPARTARALDNEVPVLAVERAEVAAVIGRDLDAGHGADVEARFVVHQDDVRRLW